MSASAGMDSQEETQEAKENKCPREEVCIPREVRIKYFPETTTQSGYDILPLFEYECYRQRQMHETSFLVNPEYAEKWQAFKDGWPESAWNIKPAAIQTTSIAVFANYRRQKVPPDYYSAFVAPPSPDAIFWKTK